MIVVKSIVGEVIHFSFDKNKLTGTAQPEWHPPRVWNGRQLSGWWGLEIRFSDGREHASKEFRDKLWHAINEFKNASTSERSPV